MATRRRKPVEEPEVVEDAFEELEDADEELEELEEDDTDAEEVEEAPKTRGRKCAPAKKAGPAPKAGKSSDSNDYSTSWLAEYVSEQTGENIDARSLRMLLRKMADNGELEREVGTDRSRYTFPKGANDPTVKLIIRKVKSGELKAAKSAGLEKVKANAAAKKTTARKAAAAAKVEEAEETPAPARRTRAAKSAPAKATPAKATPRRRTRAAAE